MYILSGVVYLHDTNYYSTVCIVVKSEIVVHVQHI